MHQRALGFVHALLCLLFDKVTKHQSTCKEVFYTAVFYYRVSFDSGVVSIVLRTRKSFWKDVGKTSYQGFFVASSIAGYFRSLLVCFPSLRLLWIGFICAVSP